MRMLQGSVFGPIFFLFCISELSVGPKLSESAQKSLLARALASKIYSAIGSVSTISYFWLFILLIPYNFLLRFYFGVWW